MATNPVPVSAPSSWLVPAVLTTLCCFPLTGVIAGYYSAQVNTRWTLGDYAGAQRAAGRARLWVLIGFFAFLLLVAVSLATGSLTTYVDRLRG